MRMSGAGSRTRELQSTDTFCPKLLKYDPYPGLWPPTNKEMQ